MEYSLSDLHRTLRNQAELIEYYRRTLQMKDWELRKANSHITLLKGVLSILRQDLNIKSDQFDYIFSHLNREEQEDAIRRAEQEERFRQVISSSCPHILHRFDYFKDLPEPVMLMVMEYLDYKDITILSCVSKEMHSLCSNSKIWQTLYRLRWRKIPELSDFEGGFRERHRLETTWYTHRPVVSTLSGHMGTVTSLAFQPNSHKFISGSDDSSVILWTYDEHAKHEGELCQQHHKQTKALWKSMAFYGHGGPVWCCSFTEDGKMVSGSYDRTVKIWNVDNGKCEHTLRGHSEWVSCIDTQGSMLYSGSWDSTVKIWNLQTRQTVGTLYNPMGNAIYCLQASGNQLITGCRSHTVDLWDLTTAAIIGSCIGHDKNVNCIRQQDYLVASGSTDNTVRLWDLRTFECIETLRGHSNPVMCLDYDSDACRLVTGSYDKTIRIWDTRSLTVPRQTLQGHSAAVFSLCFNDHKLISGSTDSTIKIWNFSV